MSCPARQSVLIAQDGGCRKELDTHFRCENVRFGFQKWSRYNAPMDVSG